MATPKRRIYSLEEKLQVLDLLEKMSESSLPKSEIARTLGIPLTTLLNWIKNQDDIRMKAIQASDISTLQKPSRVLFGKYPQLEQVLLNWYQQALANDFLISVPILKEKALNIAIQLGIYDFTPDARWVHRFNLRHNIVLTKQEA